ncbi:MAG: zinc-dependent alcohol dehydrogenase family protein [Chloroflexi bacterium]|nr:zinc-dependent alcohol dehydrogenase family protein [Chloroflexota bacterium]
MRAMVLHQQKPIEENPLQLEEVPKPHVGPGQILLHVRTCGVCHTDLHIVEGDLPLHKSPIIVGHQIVGIVEEVGPGVTQHKVGDRVGVPWVYKMCGKCEFCRSGKENLCLNPLFTGWDVDGGFAEYMVADAAFSFPIPDNVDDAHAAPLLCAGIVGYRTLKLSELQPGQRLGIYGFGASAHIVIQIARYWGAEVYVFTRSEEHKRHAWELGAAWVGEAQDTPPKKIHSAVIYAPAGWIVKEALRVLERGGTISLGGIYMTPIPELPYDLLYWEHTVRSTANATREDARELLQLAGEIPIRTDVEVFPLEEANEALRRLKHSELKGSAVLRIWEG